MAIDDAERKRKARLDARDLKIGRVAEPKRRRDCLADVFLFLPTYFPRVFSQPFTDDRREMIAAIMHAARYGGDQAVAGPRGDGKTRSALFGALMLMLSSAVEFPVIVSKSAQRAARELTNLKDAIREAELFAADFPEVCQPILDLGGWGSRARQQTAFGKYTNMEWGSECIILPTISTELLRDNGWNDDIESAARGQIMASLGVEGAIRGYSVRNRRPDLAIIDDVDDRESARSETQTDTRVHIIEEDIGGLAGPDRTIARVMLCTLINRTCVAAQFTDRKLKPSWKGQVHKLLASVPDRMDLWEEYIALRKGRNEDDPDARKAHEFYLANREAMDAGAVVTNPHRYDCRPLADGEPGQVSALQACFDLIADRDWEHFNSEYQNDPPVEDGPVESGISPNRVMTQFSGYERRVVPPECTVLTCGVDVGKAAFHWVVRAWRPDGTGFVIDYDVHEVHGTIKGSDEGLDVAIRRAILVFMQELREANYHTADGEVVPVHRVLIDAGYRTDAVYSACADLGLGVSPVMGFGQSAGCVKANFHDVQHSTNDKRPGDGWFLSRKGKVWLVCADADRWKAWEHDRWMTATGKPGGLSIFGEDTGHRDLTHHTYAHHICNEVEVEEPYRGVMRRRWKAKGKNVHYLDASYYANVAANMEGINPVGSGRARAPRVPPQGQRMSLAQMKGGR